MDQVRLMPRVWTALPEWSINIVPFSIFEWKKPEAENAHNPNLHPPLMGAKSSAWALYRAAINLRRELGDDPTLKSESIATKMSEEWRERSTFVREYINKFLKYNFLINFLRAHGIDIPEKSYFSPAYPGEKLSFWGYLWKCINFRKNGVENRDFFIILCSNWEGGWFYF